MTTLLQKDLLFTKLQEFDSAQQAVDRTRSEMHCIIAALPDTIDAPMTPREGRRGCQQGDGHRKTDSRCSLLENSCGDSRKSRPVVAMPRQSVTADSKSDIEPLVEKFKLHAEQKPKKTRVKRVSESDIRKAVKLVYDENMTQSEAERACNLPPSTLSRRKGKEIMSQYRKEWGTPATVDAQRGVSRKTLEQAWIHGDDR